MKETFRMFAEYNREANRKVFALLDKLSGDEREKDRGSYYKSLSGLFMHVVGVNKFFMGLYKGALSGKPAALKIVEDALAIGLPEGKLSDAQWKEVSASFPKLDDALVNLTDALDEKDFSLPVKWFTGDPATVPLSFMLHQLTAHNIHHRGQISQILDELKIDNNYSGIGIAFLPANE
jgi:uncharacterized damage-inducible protein DinB